MSKYAPLTTVEFEKYIQSIDTGEKLNPNGNYLESLKMTLAKWHPARGSKVGHTRSHLYSCGLCMYKRRHLFVSCVHKPICILVAHKECYHFGLWTSANDRGDKKAAKYHATRLYNRVLKEYNRVVKEGGK